MRKWWDKCPPSFLCSDLSERKADRNGYICLDQFVIRLNQLKGMGGLPRTEFAQALRAISTERGLDADVILDTIKQAIIAAYRRDAREREEDTEELEFDVELDPINGEAKIFSWPEGKKKERKDVTPPGFGRIAAQTAKQVIHQKIREAEKDAKW